MTDPQFEESLDRYFAIESEELIQTIEQTLVELLEEKTIERVHTLMRAAHTIKGGAANCGLKTIETIAHHLEDVFQALYPEELVIDDELGALLLEGYEVLYTPLSAILGGYECDEEQSLAQTADLFARLQSKLGDFFGREAPLPTAEDLGFDVVGLIFGDSVPEDLDKLSVALHHGDLAQIKALLLAQSEFFIELGASYELPGIEQIAKATTTALGLHPVRAMEIGTATLANFQIAREQILAGDRAQGGSVSAELALWTEANPDLSNYTAPVATASAVMEPEIIEISSAQAETNGAELFDLLNAENSIDSDASSLFDLFGTEDSGANDLLDLLGEETTVDNGTNDLLDLLGQETTADSDANDLLDLLGQETTADSDANDLLDLLGQETTVDSDANDLLDLLGQETTADSDANDLLDLLSEETTVDSDANDLLDLLGEDPTVDSNADELLELLTANSNEPEVLDLLAEEITATQEVDEQPEIVAEILPESIDAELVEMVEEEAAPSVAMTIVPPPAERSTALSVTDFTGEAFSDMSPIDRILQSISTYIPEAQPPQPAPAPTAAPASPTIRVAMDRLDRLSHAIGELVIDENQQNARAERIHVHNQEAIAELDRANYQLGQIRDWSDKNLLNIDTHRPRPQFRKDNSPNTLGFDSLEMDVYSDLHLLIQKLNDHLEELGGRLGRLENSTQKLRVRQDKRRQIFVAAQDELLQARMEPISTVFDRFPRLVQQMVSKHKKPADLVLVGTSVLVDKTVADKLYDPLLHLIRNSYDHGLESAETRTELGKKASGRITVSAHHHGNRTTIEVRDDGGGLNFQRIREKGIERQLLTSAQAQTATEDELAELLFHPGFSTADKVSELSGRGIGLDVVRTQIEAFDGSIAVRSVAGKGSTFSLQIPLSFTTARLLICEAKGKTYALLTDSLTQAIFPTPDRLKVAENGARTHYLQRTGSIEKLIAIRGLAESIDYNCPVSQRDAENDRLSLLLVEADGQQICFAVDRILGEQELAISSIGNALPLPTYVQGYSTLSDGSLVLAIDPVALANKSQQSSSLSFSRRPATQPVAALAEAAVEAELLPYHSSANSQITILVVDDSLVQRQGLLRTLSGAGYQVIQAANGQEALAQLNQHPEIKVVVCDIEMPYMNGFEFLSYCRQDARLSQIPTIMLTTRSGAKHRQLALALGAKAYTTKPHSDRELLAAVEGQLGATLASV
jgi:two-component system, chemotaxis family, sensor histidine kinase and response regulator PixL